MKNPLVSVCIPALNESIHIKDTISSVLKQTYKNLEIIIVDNCSNDNTVEIIQSIKDSRISLFINEKRLTLEGNWNTTIKKATGKYIKFLCADDVIEPKCIENQVYTLETNPNLSLVTCHKIIINDLGKKILKITFPGEKGRHNGKDVIKSSIKKGTNIIGEPGAGLFPTSLLKKTGLYDGQNPYLIDMDLWSRLLLHGDLFVVDEYLFNFRVSKKSISSSLGFNQFKYFKKFAQKLYESGNFNISQKDLLQSYFYAFSKNIFRNILFLIQ